MIGSIRVGLQDAQFRSLFIYLCNKYSSIIATYILLVDSFKMGEIRYGGK